MINGRCECGAVAFQVAEVRDEVSCCHCTQCRRTSGHFWAATHAPFASLKFAKDDGLKWFKSSEWAQRGFCNRCGSSLFYRMDKEDGVGIAAGCLDAPDLKAVKHIFVKDKGGYYDICDGLEQIEKY